MNAARAFKKHSSTKRLSIISERSSLVSNSIDTSNYFGTNQHHRRRASVYRVVEEPANSVPQLIGGRYSAKVFVKKRKHFLSADGGYLDDTVEDEEANQLWTCNYKEAAMFLEAGEHNEKLAFHPRDSKSRLAYRIVHSSWFNLFDFFASLTLIFLAMVEPPAVAGLQLRPSVHLSIELACLLIISIESIMKLNWMGARSFITHPRSAIKSVTLIIMIIQALVILSQKTHHIRGFRALRPVFLMESFYFEEVRRTLRQFIYSLPAILDIIILLIFIITIFSLVAFNLFATVPHNVYFTTLADSFSNLFVVISNGNFPDVMMPVYSYNKWSSIFFIVYITIQLYYVLNIMLAVAYDEFSVNAKEKFKKLFIHRRTATAKAFALLTSALNPTEITFRNFLGVVQRLKPAISKLRCYIMFKTLDQNRHGTLDLFEFFKIYDCLELNWHQVYPQVRWYDNICCWPARIVLQQLTRIAESIWLERAVMTCVCGSLVYEVIRTAVAPERTGIGLDHVHSMFITFYFLEAILKLIGLGPVHYATTGWNPFDFVVMVIAATGQFVMPYGNVFGFAYIARTVRIITLFKKTRKYNEIMGPFIFIVVRELSNFALILFVVLYFYALLGMELFADIDLANPPSDTLTTPEDYYALNNFTDILSAIVTLFVFMFGYTWFFLMDRYARLAGPWSRIYFMGFFLISTVILTIVVASIIEAFIFTISYRRHFIKDCDDQTTITRDVFLNEHELEALDQIKPIGTQESNQHNYDEEFLVETEPMPKQQALFRGKKLRSKFSFSLQMYAEEVNQWIDEIEQNEAVPAAQRVASRRRTASAQL